MKSFVVFGCCMVLISGWFGVRALDRFSNRSSEKGELK